MIRVNSVSLVPTAPHLGHLRACGSNLKQPRLLQNSKHPFTPVLEVAVKFGLTLSRRVGFGFFVMPNFQLPERLNRAQRRGSDRPNTDVFFVQLGPKATEPSRWRAR